MDLLWTYEEDEKGLLYFRYKGETKDAIAEEIVSELSSLFIEIYRLTNKVNLYEYPSRYRGIVLEKPGTLIIELYHT